jgi:hypothetical protein
MSGTNWPARPRSGLKILFQPSACGGAPVPVALAVQRTVMQNQILGPLSGGGSRRRHRFKIAAVRVRQMDQEIDAASCV